jgi:hypothetical protein
MIKFVKARIYISPGIAIYYAMTFCAEIEMLIYLSTLILKKISENYAN